MIHRLFRPLMFVVLLALAGCNSPEEEPAILPTAVPTYAVTDFASDSTAGEESNSTLTAATDMHAGPTPMATVAATSTEAVAETVDEGDGESVQSTATVAAEIAPAEPETTEDEVDLPDGEINSNEQQDAAPDTPEDESPASTSEVNTVDANSAEEIDDDAAPDSESVADVESSSEVAVEQGLDAAVVSDEEQSAEENDETPMVGDEVDDLYAGLPASIAALIPEADAARGEQLSLQNGCIGCHNLDPKVVMAGPTWYGLGDTAAERVDDQSAALYLYQSIINPNDYVVDGYMPNIMLQTYGDTLSEQDQADLIAYLLSLHEE